MFRYLTSRPFPAIGGFLPRMPQHDAVASGAGVLLQEPRQCWATDVGAEREAWCERRLHPLQAVR